MARIREPFRSAGIRAPFWFAFGAIVFGGVASKDIIDRIHPMGWGHSDHELTGGLVGLGICLAAFLLSYAMVRVILASHE